MGVLKSFKGQFTKKHQKKFRFRSKLKIAVPVQPKSKHFFVSTLYDAETKLAVTCLILLLCTYALANIVRQTDKQTNLFTRIVKTKRKKKQLIYLFDKTTMYDNL